MSNEAIDSNTPATILVLEDEPLIAMDLCMALEDAGAQPHSAINSEEAFALIEAHQIDGAILDVNLGHGETCKDVAEELKRLEVVFVLHTGDLDRSGELVRAIDAPVVPKPANPEQVVAEILSMSRAAA